ncbi:hypothetical protein IA539_04930 [Gordonia sp. zg691]|uniref:Uncharacterized protein n=1 Tax=Gordonia jinghuaiqii TaxID=2758710 RepID=A0A7D7LTT2_9ACTN|nr:hypothetical protein [Gordonia jinghuaiqii]MBD0860552.1 hypothetical protein [Gordonia jinghuaiqii]QMT01361.1 hypothetical protein H1R19_21485 [Gordonia jinghuaiqii]
MAPENNKPNKQRELSTYFSGRFSMFVTYPIVLFIVGLLVGYLMSR